MPISLPPLCRRQDSSSPPGESIRVSDFLAAIETGAFDLILADYSIPGFDGMTALSLARQQAPDIPFLFVSATIGEELAIDAMHHGATDYVLKQRLGRLVPSVQRALRERDERRERKRAEEALGPERTAVPAGAEDGGGRSARRRHRP